MFVFASGIIRLDALDYSFRIPAGFDSGFAEHPNVKVVLQLVGSEWTKSRIPVKFPLC